MLKVMRESFQHLKWILVFIVFLFIAYVFVGWGTGGATGGSIDESTVAARVNGDTITVNEYRRALVLTEQRYREMYGQQLTPEMVAALGLERQVLDDLVSQELLLQEARRMNLEATNEEVRKKILEIPTLNPNGKFIGAQLYERFVKMNGYPSAAAFEADVAEQLTISKLESALQSTIAVPASLVESEYRRREENAKIRYALVSPDKVMQSVTVTPAEVEQFYKANSSRYAHGEQKQITYLLADVATLQSQIRIPDEELRRQYEQNKESYKTGEQVRAQHILIRVEQTAPSEQVEAAKNKARDLVAKLRAGADFAAMAKEHSADPGSAVNGGDLGFFSRGQMVPEFENAAFGQPVGQVGDPVKSQFGFHIIKTNEKRTAGYRPFEEVKNELMQTTAMQRARTQARDRIAQIRARLEQVKPLNEQAMRNAADTSVTYNSAPAFGKNDAIEGLGRVPAISTWAFGAREGDLGPIIDTQRGPVVPFLKQSRAAGVAPLAEIRAKVEQDARVQKAREQAAQMLRAAIRPGVTLEAIAAQSGVSPIDSDVSREGYISGLQGDNSKLIEAAFNAKVGEVKGPIIVDAGALAFEVTEEKKFDRAAFDKAKDGLAASLRRNEALKLRSSLLDRLKKESDVQLNQKLVAGDAQAATPIS
jgi:peptidyl-prolyl cis-trans isomerase D